ncbi:lipoprotein [Mycoplasma mycoides]|uniref:lipoprotein n=1 Tax=Mycoplasma mycoides TaxID=2102 RepID=UPI00223FDE72|nr:lipoprotein [Mycoplasma mycoides]QVK06302.1 lipoprotein [Mycoplasma mycoides subsp. capri]
MKKLLTLLGSVAVIGSTAAVAIACEGKPLKTLVSKNEEQSKPQTLESKQEAGTESENEGKTEKLQADDANVNRTAQKSKREELKELQEEVKKAREESRIANQKYQDAIRKGEEEQRNKKEVSKETGKEIDETESEAFKASLRSKELEKKLKKLQREFRTPNEGDASGATIEV